MNHKSQLSNMTHNPLGDIYSKLCYLRVYLQKHFQNFNIWSCLILCPCSNSWMMNRVAKNAKTVFLFRNKLGRIYLPCLPPHSKLLDMNQFWLGHNR